MNKKIAVIIVNYKDYARKFLKDCRDSLKLQSQDSTVYIVDNASSAESFKYLSDNYPEAIIIPRDDGNYCAANNTGARQAIASGAEILVFANMDTVFDKDWLLELTKVFSDDSVGISQSKIFLYKEDGSRLINSLGNKLHFLGFGFTDGYNLADKELRDVTDIYGYASGCSLAILANDFSKIGGYNEEYYMYHDDIELSAKLRLLGKRIVLANKSELSHKYEFSRSARMVYYMERNRALFIFSFYPIRLIVLLIPALVISEFFILLASIFGGWFKSKIKSYWYFCQFSTWQKIKRSRKENVSPKLNKWLLSFSGSLDFQEVDGLLLKIANPLMKLYWRVVKLFFR